MRLLPLITICLLLASCDKNNKVVMGYEPVYTDTTGYTTISLSGAQEISAGGKIYVYNKTLYQVETDKGIHILDISDAKNPKKLAFIHIKGCREVSAKGDTLFANNFKDLVVLSVKNNQLQVLQRLPENFATNNLSAKLPPERGYFKCPAESAGKIITGWRKTQLTNPDCHY